MFRKSVLPPVLSWYVRSSFTPRCANRSVSMRWTIGGAQLRLDVVAD
jgi:hypothetical protein